MGADDTAESALHDGTRRTEERPAPAALRVFNLGLALAVFDDDDVGVGCSVAVSAFLFFDARIDLAPFADNHVGGSDAGAASDDRGTLIRHARSIGPSMTERPLTITMVFTTPARPLMTSVRLPLVTTTTRLAACR
jgi:hypothetical protein